MSRAPPACDIDGLAGTVQPGPGEFQDRRTCPKGRHGALGYRAELFEREVPDQRTKILAMIVADINNPVFHGMVRGAERTAAHDGYTVLVVETQESGAAEQSAVQRVLSSVDGIILTSSRMSDSAIRAFAKQRPLVVMNRVVDQVASVANDNVEAIKQAVEHLADSGVGAITYLAGPEASWADGMRWRGLLEAGHDLELKVDRIGPCDPTMSGGGETVASKQDSWGDC